MATGRRITDKESELLYMGLAMRRNLIETGDPHHSAVDVEKMGDACDLKVRALTSEQMKFILEIEELKEKVRKKLLIIVD